MKGELSPKATERFGRNDFENLSVICFANATSPERRGFIRGEKRPPLDRGGLSVSKKSFRPAAVQFSELKKFRKLLD